MEMPNILKVYQHYVDINPNDNTFVIKLFKPETPEDAEHHYHHSRIVEALKAENEELRKERDELADIIKGMPRYAEELRKTDGYLSGGMKINLCHDIDKLAKKVNKNGNA